MRKRHGKHNQGSTHCLWSPPYAHIPCGQFHALFCAQKSGKCISVDSFPSLVSEHGIVMHSETSLGVQIFLVGDGHVDMMRMTLLYMWIRLSPTWRFSCCFSFVMTKFQRSSGQFKLINRNPKLARVNICDCRSWNTQRFGESHQEHAVT